MILAALLLALAGDTRIIAPCESRLGAKPDVLVIVADDLGWPEWELMPNVQALSAQGVLFYQFRTTGTCCCPTRLSFQFGQYARRMGIGDLSLNPHSGTDDRLPLAPVTIAEQLKASGYLTTLIGKWHLGRAPLLGLMDRITSAPFCQGYDVWRAGMPAHVGAGNAGANYYKWSRGEDGALSVSTVYATDAQRDTFLSQWTGPHPRFTFLAWGAPHLPWSTPPGMSDQPTDRGDYEQVVSYLDGAIGAVLAAVDLQTTYVVFVADNGTPLQAAPVPGFDGFWKHSVFEGGINVPLVIAGPGISPGTSDRLVSSVDLPATLAELANVPAAGSWFDSVSFADELGIWLGAPPRAFTFSEQYEVQNEASFIAQDAMAYVEGETTWPGTSITVQLKRVVTDMDGPGPGTSTDYLYNLLADPWEQAPGPFATAPAAVKARFSGYAATLPARVP